MSLFISNLRETGNIEFFQQLETIESIKLDAIDPYSLETFNDLISLRSHEGLDIYVALIKEDMHCYPLEASRLLEQIFKKNNRNPLTNKDISYFKVFKFSKEKKCFEFYAHSNQITQPFFYLPVLLSDHTRAKEECLDYMHKMACVYLQSNTYDLQKALEYLTIASKGGLKKSQKFLGTLLIKNYKKEEGIFWYKKYLEDNSDSPIDLIFLASEIAEFNPKESLDLFEKAALMGNYLAIANVIGIYEQDGQLKNVSKACLWRATLPKEWQDSAMNNFIRHLESENYDFKNKH